MTTKNNTPTDEALENLEEAAAREGEAVQEVTEEVVDDVAEEVAEASDAATEAATEAAEAVEEAVEAATEAHPDLDLEQHGDIIYNRVLQRLQEDGHIASPAVAEEVAGEAEHDVEVVAEAPVEAVEEAPAYRPDTRPVSEHWYYRPRRIFGRTF